MFETGTAVTPNGSIKVKTTDMGVPMELYIDQGQMSREPADLASDILKLCKRASQRALYDRRVEMEARGVNQAILDRMKLPTREDVIAAEQQAEADFFNNEAEVSWLRKI